MPVVALTRRARQLHSNSHFALDLQSSVEPADCIVGVQYDLAVWISRPCYSQPSSSVSCEHESRPQSSLTCPFTFGLLFPLVKCFNFHWPVLPCPSCQNLGCTIPSASVRRGGSQQPNHGKWGHWSSSSVFIVKFNTVFGVDDASLVALWMMFSLAEKVMIVISLCELPPNVHHNLACCLCTLLVGLLVK